MRRNPRVSPTASSVEDRPESHPACDAEPTHEGIVMRTSSAILCSVICSAAISGCGSKQAPPAPEVRTEPARYDAKAFFATTTYTLPPGYAWSHDHKQLLVSSDETG